MRCLAIAIAVTLVAAAAAKAQDRGSVGISMGYPASIGIVWHMSDRVALRPEISLQEVSSRSTSSLTFTTGIGSSTTTTVATTESVNDQWAVGYGVSALFYLQRWDALRTYVSPRFVYTRTTSHSTTTTSPAVAALVGPQTNVDFASNTYLFSGSLGAQYALGEHFGLFGEVGASYSRQNSDSTSAIGGSTEGHAFAIRSGAGVIVYFR